MGFFNSSSTTDGNLDPRVMEVLAEAHRRKMSPDEIAQMLQSAGIDPMQYQEPLAYGMDDSLPELANALSPPGAGDAGAGDAGGDDSSFDWTGGGKRPSFMPPPATPAFWPGKAGLPTPTGADAPPMSVAETAQVDPGGDIADSVNPTPDPSVKTSPVEAPDPGMFDRVKSAFGNDSLAKALMATGFGIMGARGTYGDTAQALGQGGMYGLASLEKSQARQDANAVKREEAASKEKLAKSAQQIQKDKLGSDDANRKLQRLKDRADIVLRMIDSGNADQATAAVGADKELRSYIGLPEGATLKNKPQAPGSPLDEIKKAILSRMTPDEQKQYMLKGGESGGNPDSPNNQLGEIIRAFRKGGWSALPAPDAQYLAAHISDPDVAAAIRAANDPLGPVDVGKMTEEQRNAYIAKLARDAKTARESAAGGAPGGGASHAAKASVLSAIGVR